MRGEVTRDSLVNTAEEDNVVFILNGKRGFKQETLILNKEVTGKISFRIFPLEMSKIMTLLKGRKKKNCNQLDEPCFPKLR